MAVTMWPSVAITGNRLAIGGNQLHQWQVHQLARPMQARTAAGLGGERRAGAPSRARRLGSARRP